tara:strand:- start:1332 stop:2237 length:906 start_codon:yes stop_codon:yes gene_type:complete
MVILGNEKVAKVAQKFICKICDYECCRRCNFEKHLATQKHKNHENGNNGNEKVAKSSKTIYVCEKCQKSYFYNSGLSRHKKICDQLILSSKNTKHESETAVITNKIDDNTIIKELKDIIVQQQQQISELIPRIGNTTNNTTQNNRFNINVFLDEKCRDAINMSDFVKSIQVSLEQLDYTKRNGLADGLTRTIMENMNRLSIYERPLHCTDIKRETLYIKEDDKWSKDDSHERLKEAIRKASYANYKGLKEWCSKHPGYEDSDRLTEYFTKTVIELSRSFEGIDDKVLRHICREIYIKNAIF